MTAVIYHEIFAVKLTVNVMQLVIHCQFTAQNFTVLLVLLLPATGRQSRLTQACTNKERVDNKQSLYLSVEQISQKVVKIHQA